MVHDIIVFVNAHGPKLRESRMLCFVCVMAWTMALKKQVWEGLLLEACNPAPFDVGLHIQVERMQFVCCDLGQR